MSRGAAAAPRVRHAARRVHRRARPSPRLAGAPGATPGFAALRATGRRFDCLRPAPDLEPKPAARRLRARARRGARPQACRTTLPAGRPTQART